MKFFLKMCYAYPELTNPVRTEEGAITNARAPGSPTRVAGERDFNTWWEEVDVPEWEAAAFQTHHGMEFCVYAGSVGNTAQVLRFHEAMMELSREAQADGAYEL